MAEGEAYGEQDENGIDIARLRRNLTLTPTERIRQHERAVEFMLKCMRAAEDARLRGADRSPDE